MTDTPPASDVAKRLEDFPWAYRASLSPELREAVAYIQALEAREAELRKALESALAMLRHAHDRISPRYAEYETLRVSLANEARDVLAALSKKPLDAEK